MKGTMLTNYDILFSERYTFVPKYDLSIYKKEFIMKKLLYASLLPMLASFTNSVGITLQFTNKTAYAFHVASQVHSKKNNPLTLRKVLSSNNTIQLESKEENSCIMDISIAKRKKVEGQYWIDGQWHAVPLSPLVSDICKDQQFEITRLRETFKSIEIRIQNTESKAASTFIIDK